MDKIASLFGIWRRTLYRISQEYGLMDLYNFTRVSNHDLDGQVSCIKQFMPDAGQSMVKGAEEFMFLFLEYKKVS